ncbi:MAG TPA: anaerobic ribonucleoside-triphosphate reductase activating protein [Clostridiales bacterium]|nr:anaerobic ribonucleoside-triphosphate reductase activating protein [Clostridiales bacterium]
MSEKLRVAGIVNDSITDGPGLRLAVFLQGCQRNCPGCHNPAALPLAGGTCYTAEELMEPARKNPLLSGVTLSGGEPLLQAKALLPFARAVKDAGLSIMLYTGYTFAELLEQADGDVMELLSLCDTLVDGPFLMAERSLSLPFRGSRNQRILDLPKSLARGEAVEQL